MWEEIVIHQENRVKDVLLYAEVLWGSSDELIEVSLHVCKPWILLSEHVFGQDISYSNVGVEQCDHHKSETWVSSQPFTHVVPLTQFEQPALSVRVEESVRQVIAVILRDFEGLILDAVI